jgi:GNAT superfamily N-acetyltransferase
MNIRFERTCERDAKAIIDVRNKSFYDDFVKFGECPGYNIAEDAMKHSIHSSIMYNIIADEQVIGNVSFHNKDNGACWIGCLAIIPEYQNRGIGFKTIKFLEAKYPEVKVWELETPVQNHRNCYFYEKCGFVKVDEKVHSDKLTLRVYKKIIGNIH